MGGQGHHDDHHKGNEHNLSETDEDMPFKIRPIDLIKYNPNLFHMWVYDPANVINTLGGIKYEITALTGGLIGYWYY